MAASILQEYLVKIGYQTDAMSYHKFSQNLDGVTGKVFKLGLQTCNYAEIVRLTGSIFDWYRIGADPFDK